MTKFKIHYFKLVGNPRVAAVSTIYSDILIFQQRDITDRMRGILIDWLIEAHYKFELTEETLYLTVNLVDRFLSRRPIVRKNIQLVGITAMLLACKYEEVTEKEMMNTLEFNLSVLMPFVFVKRFLKAARSYKEMEQLCFYLIDLCLVEYEMLKFPPSLLAVAGVFTAESTLKGSKQWTKTSEFHSQYSQNHLL
ncbi:putative cyclin domain-containing protein [Helianthus annuus]|nr:putative cyclin domain-containing protein [Helianthus annuus]